MKTELKTEEIYYFLILSYFQCVANGWILGRQVKTDKIIHFFFFVHLHGSGQIAEPRVNTVRRFPAGKNQLLGCCGSDPSQSFLWCAVQSGHYTLKRENASDSIKYLNIFLLNNCVNEDGGKKSCGAVQPCEPEEETDGGIQLGVLCTVKWFVPDIDWARLYSTLFIPSVIWNLKTKPRRPASIRWSVDTAAVNRHMKERYQPWWWWWWQMAWIHDKHSRLFAL